jgi:hypothetical protein
MGFLRGQVVFFFFFFVFANGFDQSYRAAADPGIGGFDSLGCSALANQLPDFCVKYSLA